MSHVALRGLIGAALVDRNLCDGLMNGRRSALLAEFDLSDEEREVVASFENESVRDLASAVHSWLKEQGNSASPRVDCSSVQVL
jgi:hypothetical protein